MNAISQVAAKWQEWHDNHVEEFDSAYRGIPAPTSLPSLEDFINSIDFSSLGPDAKEARRLLYISLLRVEADWRLRRNETLLRHETTFPEYADETDVTLKDYVADSANSLPEEFDTYLLIERLGEGGMGVVYKASDRKLRRIVALKRIKNAGPEDFERFRQEADAAARCNGHPNIVELYDCKTFKGTPFLLMRYVKGGNSLEEVLRHGRLNPKVAAQVMYDVARAIQYAHEHGVVHRDLKPGNILLDAEEAGSTQELGRPLVCDFGLARVELSADETAYRRKTLDGMFLGTPGYVSPEQADGQQGKIDKSTDIYSLGAVLYCALTGYPPFRAAGPVLARQQVLELEPISPRQQYPDIHRDLETIVLKCLRKEPKERYGSAKELVTDLKLFIEDRPIHARPPGAIEYAWRWCKYHRAVTIPASVIAAILLIATGVSIWFERTAAYQAHLLSRQLVANQVASGWQRMDDGDATGSLPHFVEALHRDRTELDWSGIHQQRVATTVRSLPELKHVWWHDGPIVQAEFSPDGLKVLTASSDGTARVWDSASGAPLTTPLKHSDKSSVKVIHATFNPEATQLVTAGDDSFARLWDVKTGLPKGRPLEHPATVLHSAFSPDGRYLATASGEKMKLQAKPSRVPDPRNALKLRVPTPPAFQQGTVKIWDTSTGLEMGPPLKQKGWMQYVEFSSDGQLLVSAAGVNKESINILGNSTAQVWHWKTGERVGRALEESEQILQASLSPDGHRLLTLGGDAGTEGVATLWHLEGAPEGAIAMATPQSQFHGIPLLHKGRVVCGKFNSDGLRFATASWDGTVRSWDSRTGRQVGAAIRHPDQVTSVVYSRDDRLLATACRDGIVRLWDAETGEPVGVPLVHSAAIAVAAFSRNGEWLLTATLAGEARLWDLTAPRRQVPSLAHAGRLTYAAYSSDGRRIITAVSGQTSAISMATAREDAVFRYPRRDIRIWDANTLRSPQTEPEVTVTHEVLSVDADANRMIALRRFVGGTSELQAWDIRSGQRLGPPLSRKTQFSAVVQNPDGQSAYVGQSDGVLAKWLILEGQYQTAYQHAAPVQQVALSRDGRWLVTVAGHLRPPASISKPSPAANKPIEGEGDKLKLKGRQQLIRSATFEDADSVDGLEDWVLRIQDVTSGHSMEVKHPPRVRQVAFSRDSSHLLVVSGQLGLETSGVVSVREISSGSKLGKGLDHSRAVLAATFSPDGLRVLTASIDGWARLWNVSEGKLERIFRHDGAVHSAEFAADNRRIVTASADRTARVWDARTGEPISPPLRHPGAVHHASFNFVGDTVITACEDGSARLWSLKSLESDTAELFLVSEVLSGRRSGSGGVPVVLDAHEFRRAWRELEAIRGRKR